MSGYVFVSNSTKPTKIENESMDDVVLSNVNKPWLEEAIKHNYDVFLGVNRKNAEFLKCILPIKMYDSHTYRSIFNFKDNYVAYKNLYNCVKCNDIKVIHCNTPVGGLIGRIVGKKMKIKKVIYTAHGFHFYKGAPIFNNTILKFAEKIMAKWTDVIITMNKEDYQNALKFKMRKNGKVYFIHGVGISLKDFEKVIDVNEIRTKLGITDDQIAVVSAGDLVKRKNYKTALKAIAETKNDRIHYYVCGTGPEKNKLLSLSKKLKIEDRVHFFGFRSDVKEIMMASDIFLFTSFQEGMPRALMEAMACGLPCVASRIRGNVDLMENSAGGALCAPKDYHKFSEKLLYFANNHEARKQAMEINKERIKNYDISVVKEEIKQIYQENLR